ncbi:hypothetical protein HDE_06423 [Halotydeus destructor]|nr:hypothetical protein HDE_06423 [Halotydeus destructor]
MPLRYTVAMKLILLIVLTVVHYGNCSKFSKKECDAMLLTSDKCQQDLFVHHFEKMPTGVDDIKTKYCDNAMKWLQCALSWRVCSSGFERTLVSISGNSQRKLLKESCRSAQSRKQLSDSFACLDPVDKDDVVFVNGKNAIAKQLNDDIIVLLDLATTQSTDRFLPYLCCTGHYLQQHIQAVMEKECNKRGIRLVGDHFYTKYLMAYLSEAMELVCSNLSSAEVCRKKEAKVWEELRSTVESRDVPYYNHSTVIGMGKFIGWLSNIQADAT